MGLSTRGMPRDQLYGPAPKPVLRSPAAKKADNVLDGLTGDSARSPKAEVQDELLSSVGKSGGNRHRGFEGDPPAPAPAPTPAEATPPPAPSVSGPAPVPARRPPTVDKPMTNAELDRLIARQHRTLAQQMAEANRRERFVGNRRMIPMRRIWERVGAVVTDRLEPRAAGRTAIASLESRLTADENRRDLVKRLYTLHMLADDVDQAADAAERWARKAPLDPEALRARADVAARQGDRDGAIRILGSVVEVRADDAKAQQRLARVWRWSGRPELACRPLEAFAELHPGDAPRVVEAVRCARRNTQYELADELVAAADPKAAATIQKLLERPDPDGDGLHGDVRVEASWSGGDADLDLAIVDPRGQRVSWFGGPTRATLSARDAVSLGREALALRGAGAGEYVIEIERAAGDDDGRIIHGEVTVTAVGTRQRIPFTLRGQHARVAIAQITLQSRLVPLGGGVQTTVRPGVKF
jgi:tetratricopeptide (TPR) repeat protein